MSVDFIRKRDGFFLLEARKLSGEATMASCDDLGGPARKENERKNIRQDNEPLIANYSAQFGTETKIKLFFG